MHCTVKISRQGVNNFHLGKIKKKSLFISIWLSLINISIGLILILQQSIWTNILFIVYDMISNKLFKLSTYNEYIIDTVNIYIQSSDFKNLILSHFTIILSLQSHLVHFCIIVKTCSFISTIGYSRLGHELSDTLFNSLITDQSTARLPTWMFLRQPVNFSRVLRVPVGAFAEINENHHT